MEIKFKIITYIKDWNGFDRSPAFPKTFPSEFWAEGFAVMPFDRSPAFPKTFRSESWAEGFAVPLLYGSPAFPKTFPSESWAEGPAVAPSSQSGKNASSSATSTKTD